jgi:hypothetical protein
METTRHSIGPFSFTWRGDSCWWRYKSRHFGSLITATGRTSHSLGEKLKAHFESPANTWAASGLADFVGYFLTDVPGARHWAEHYTRIRQTVKGV